MYKILIKKPQLPKDTFTFYSETTSIIDDEKNVNMKINWE